MIRGKRLVVVDDSIVRGNTQRALVRMLREAGALEVHVRIASPPVKWPCFYGIDFASRAELIANGLEVDGIRASVGADSLGFISLEGLIAASEQPKTRLCRACFDGDLPDRAARDPRRQARARRHREVGAATARRTPARSASRTTRCCVRERAGLPTMTSYRAAGVDIEAGERAVELMKASVGRTRAARGARRPRWLRRTLRP